MRWPQDMFGGCLIFFLVYGSTEEDESGCRVTEVMPRFGSVYGSTPVVIDGSGFLVPEYSNPWDQLTVYFGVVECDLIASMSTSTRVVCMTRPAPNLDETDELRVSVTIRCFF